MATSPPAPPPLVEPAVKRAVAFFDGQNLFHAAPELFGHAYPNYDPIALARRLCAEKGWQLDQVRFYTGLPGAAEDWRWHRFWSSKLRGLRSAGAHVFSRPLRYRDTTITLRYTGPARVRFYLPDGSMLPTGTRLYLPAGHELPDGAQIAVRVGEEKGIDVRLALDVIRVAHGRAYDVGLIFSQDQDLAEAAEEIRHIAREQGRWIKLASAFPWSPTSINPRGINNTDWLRIDQPTYDACLDPRNYWPRP
jgi:uncharacterized LabA/DUF88 family protein